jgi:hypothetical protein
MSVDLKLDTATHDLVIENGDFQLINDEDEVAQSVKIRLLFWHGEWLMDASLGVKYIDGIYSLEVSQEEKDQIIKTAILGTPHVKRILDYTFDVDTVNHTAEITTTILSDYGDAVIEITS